jgi:hypothetical protein
VLAYLALVEGAKRVFYAHMAVAPAAGRRG